MAAFLTAEKKSSGKGKVSSCYELVNCVQMMRIKVVPLHTEYNSSTCTHLLLLVEIQ